MTSTESSQFQHSHTSDEMFQQDLRAIDRRAICLRTFWDRWDLHWICGFEIVNVVYVVKVVSRWSTYPTISKSFQIPNHIQLKNPYANTLLDSTWIERSTSPPLPIPRAPEASAASLLLLRRSRSCHRTVAFTSDGLGLLYHKGGKAARLDTQLHWLGSGTYCSFYVLYEFV